MQKTGGNRKIYGEQKLRYDERTENRRKPQSRNRENIFNA